MSALFVGNGNRLLSDWTICTAEIHFPYDGIGMMQEEPEKLAAYSSFMAIPKILCVVVRNPSSHDNSDFLYFSNNTFSDLFP